MPLYLIRFGYTPEEWAKTIKQPEDRRATIGPLLEAIGGKLHGLWYAFGDHDGYALAEAPDNTAAASTLLTLTGSGKFRSLSTTVLLTVEETLDTLRRAQAAAPGSRGSAWLGGAACRRRGRVHVTAEVLATPQSARTSWPPRHAQGDPCPAHELHERLVAPPRAQHRHRERN